MSCTEGIAKVLDMFRTVITAIKIGAPIILLVAGMINFTRAIFNPDKFDTSKALETFKRMAIAAVCVFMVPTIINAVLHILGSENINTMLNCSGSSLESQGGGGSSGGGTQEGTEGESTETEPPDGGGSDTRISDPALSKGGSSGGTTPPAGGTEQPPSVEQPEVPTPEITPSPGKPPENTDTNTINVGTWNLARGRKKSGSVLGEEIASNNLDIIGTQEVRPSGGSGNSLASSVASGAGMDYILADGAGANYNAIFTKLSYGNEEEHSLTKCGESRVIQKVVIKVNEVDISFYNMHTSYQEGCPAKQVSGASGLFNSDPNPIILVGDFNVATKCNKLTSSVPSSFQLVAYDSLRAKSVKCTDSILIDSKGKLEVQNVYTLDYSGKYSDHNMVVATINVK